MAAAAYPQNAVLRAGDTVFRLSPVEHREAAVSGAGGVALADSAGNPSLRFSTGISRGSALISIPLPTDKIRGASVEVRARVRVLRMSAPSRPYNGLKVMLRVSGPTVTRYPQAGVVQGDTSWQEVSFSALILHDAVSAELVLGLEEVEGIADISAVVVTVQRAPRRPAAQFYRPRSKFPLHGETLSGAAPRLRGAMVATDVRPADLHVLWEWGANLIRYQLTWGGFPSDEASRATPEEYTAWLAQTLPHLDQVLDTARALGLRVVVDLHTPPGGQDALLHWRLFEEVRWQNVFLDAWDTLARRYRGHPAVWAFDLMNEPLVDALPPGVADWPALAAEAILRIRAVDSSRIIVYEPSPSSTPDALPTAEILALPGVVYSFHMYYPDRFTHQGLYGRPAGIRYPGRTHDGRRTNKADLRRALEPIAAWAAEYGVEVFVGEFSAVRWAPGRSAERYLRDCISLFEEYGWHWAYHAFRESDVWSVEHEGTGNPARPARRATRRARILKHAYSRN